MRRADALRLALREFADPACRRCAGRGYRKEPATEHPCQCVRRDTPAAVEQERAKEFDWERIARRAQQIHAADVLERVPDTWS